MTVDQAIVDALVAAAGEPTDETLTALRPLLADDVVADGLFVSGTGPDEVIEGIRNAQPPVLGMATFGDPVADGDHTLVPGTLPEGLPIKGVNLLLRASGGRLTELVQEIVEATPAPTDGMHVDEDAARFVNSAFERGAPLVLAYVDPSGAPKVSYRGTIQSHRDDALAMWVRNPKGGLLNAIEVNPQVAILGSDHPNRTHYEFHGRARVVHDEVERKAVFDASPEHERKIDAAMRGVAVVIEVDELRGGSLGATVHRRRS